MYAFKLPEEATTMGYNSRPPTFRSSSQPKPEPYLQPLNPYTPTYSINPYQPQLQHQYPIRYSEPPQPRPRPQPSSSSEYSQSSYSLTSMTSQPKTQENDIGCTLAELEQKLTFEMLSLREEKLTLMEEQNSVTDRRFKVQREISRLEKKLEDRKRETERETTMDTQASMEKQEGAIQYSELTAEECEIMEQILNLKQANNEMMLELYQQNNQIVAKERQKQKQPIPISNGQSSYLLYLRSKKQKLLKTLLSQLPTKSLIDPLLALLTSNQELQGALDGYLYRERNRLKLLREKVREEEEGKKKVLEEIVGIKAKVRSLRAENQEFRAALAYFRFRF